MSINNSFSYNKNKQDSDIDVNLNNHISENQLSRKSTRPFGKLFINQKEISLSMKQCNAILDECASAWSTLNLKGLETTSIEIDGYEFEVNTVRVELIADTIQRTKDVVMKKYRFG